MTARPTPTATGTDGDEGAEQTARAMERGDPGHGTARLGRGTPVLQADSVREVVDCPLCGSARHRPLTNPIPDGECHSLAEPWRSMRFQMVGCVECGLAYQRIRPRREDIGNFYKEEYHCYESLLRRGPIVRTFAQLFARRLIRSIERVRPPECDLLVDFGCGSGAWLELFASVQAPWRMIGTEISPWLIDQVKALGFDGYVCDDSNVDKVFAPESVGIVHMNHVIEHVQSPLMLFEKLRRILVPGGVIVGQTPDRDCLEARVFGDYWVQWHLPRHMVIFDKATMRRHAEDAGLEVVAIESSPSGAVIWSASILKYWAHLRGRPYRVTHEPLQAPLMLLFAPMSYVQSRFAGTSHMDFILRKPSR